MIDIDDKNEWKECIDIAGVRMPTGYYFGASAATGDLAGKTLAWCLLHIYLVPNQLSHTTLAWNTLLHCCLVGSSAASQQDSDV